MKIDLDQMTAFAVAERFALDIYTHMLGRRLAHVEVPLQSDYTPIPEIRMAVKSITDRYERRRFISDIRYHFHNHRLKQGTPARWQDYVQAVRKHEAERAA